eukprot:NODE_14190_length_1123_cov_3.574297.p1 GENE.NODE_14190_length_1123_cov_3.574297~~NODE_14190_length_1123_cov_3.574297.p1  ORF type:complete len:225 (+),score=54.41 NODE_14190_length_1123_cov_3.574297:106-780(+)
MTRMLFLAALVLATSTAQEDDSPDHTDEALDAPRDLWGLHHCLPYEETTRVTCAWDVNRHECHKRGCCWHAGHENCYKNHDMCVKRPCGHRNWNERDCEDHSCCWSRSRHGCFHHRFVGSGSLGSAGSGGSSGSSSSSAGASSSLPVWLLLLMLILGALVLFALIVVVILRLVGGKKDKKKKKGGNSRAITMTANTGAGGVVATQPAFSAMATPVPVVQALVAN